MEMNRYQLILYDAKRDMFHTGDYDIKVTTSKDKLLKKIQQKDSMCSKCKQTLPIKSVIIEFHQPQELTIFQAGMLYALFCLNKIPADYAEYHKCEAGKKFIENIKKVIV